MMNSRLSFEYKIGDCLVLLKDVPDNSVPLVLTDPPFGVNYDYESDGFKDVGGEEYFEWVDKWMREVMRVLTDTGVFLCFSSPKYVREFLNIGHSIGFKYQDLIIWDKKFSMACNGPRPMPMIEPCYFWTKGDKWTFNHVGLSNCIHVMRESPDPDYYHRATRPVALYEKLISAFSKPGDLVLDPFLGSGTTLLSCRRTGRGGLGFEIDGNYEELIKRKIMMDVKGLDAFIGVIV
jgi:site-specific DNA-methyltransferase (adenine-specific)